MRDEALFRDPPPKEDCPICFLPMPERLFSCASLPPATRLSVPIYDFAEVYENEAMTEYYVCCGKRPFVKDACTPSVRLDSDRSSKTIEDKVEDNLKRVEANDAASICLLAHDYNLGRAGFQQDKTKAMELYVRAADLGHSQAHNNRKFKEDQIPL